MITNEQITVSRDTKIEAKMLFYKAGSEKLRTLYASMYVGEM
jgi:hypothetical protein